MRRDRAAVGNHLFILHSVYLGMRPHSSTGYHELLRDPALICLGWACLFFWIPAKNLRE